MPAGIKGTRHDDTLDGTDGDDTINAGQGGNDTIDAAGGDDKIWMGKTLTADDRIDGGTGFDIVTLKGDYSAGLTFSATTMVNVEELGLIKGHDYNLTMDDGNVASGERLTVDAGSLLATDRLTLDASAEHDGYYTVIGGAGDDTIHGGQKADIFTLTRGGDDTVYGNAGHDVFRLGASLNAADHLDGGAGNDTLSLDGDYSAGVTLLDDTIANIETIKLDSGFSYKLTLADGNVGAGQTLTVDGSALATGNALTFDAGAETDGHFAITAGAGDDIITLNTAVAALSTVNGGAGNNTLVLSGGTTELALGDSNLQNVDTIAFADGASYSGVHITGGASIYIQTIDASALTGTSGISVDLTADKAQNIAFTGGNGDDTVTFDQNFNMTYKYVGGGGFNTAVFAQGESDGGSYWISSGYVSNLDKIVVEDSPSQNFRFNGDASHNGTMTVDATALTSGHGAIFGLAGSTIANLTVDSGSGDDIFRVGIAVTAGMTFDAGAGTDTLEFNGSNALTPGVATLLNFEKFVFDSGHNYSVTVNDATVAAGNTLTVDASVLGSANAVTFNGGAETDGHFKFLSGAGADVFTGGQLSDTFVFNYLNDSTSTAHDTITNIDFSSDVLHLSAGSGGYTPTGIDAAIVSGALSSTTFDTGLAADVNASNLAAHHAVLFTADSGTLSGHTFLVVDVNGTAGYQASADYVIDVTGYSGTLSTGTFI